MQFAYATKLPGDFAEHSEIFFWAIFSNTIRSTIASGFYNQSVLKLSCRLRR